MGGGACPPSPALMVVPPLVEQAPTVYLILLCCLYYEAVKAVFTEFRAHNNVMVDRPVHIDMLVMVFGVRVLYTLFSVLSSVTAFSRSVL